MPATNYLPSTYPTLFHLLIDQLSGLCLDTHSSALLASPLLDSFLFTLTIWVRSVTTHTRDISPGKARTCPDTTKSLNYIASPRLQLQVLSPGQCTGHLVSYTVIQYLLKHIGTHKSYQSSPGRYCAWSLDRRHNTGLQVIQPTRLMDGFTRLTHWSCWPCQYLLASWLYVQGLWIISPSRCSPVSDVIGQYSSCLVPAMP